MSITVLSGKVLKGNNFNTPSLSNVSLKKGSQPITVSKTIKKAQEIIPSLTEEKAVQLTSMIAGLPSAYPNSIITGESVKDLETVPRPETKSPWLEPGNNVIDQLISNFQGNTQSIIDDVRQRELDFRESQLDFFAEQTRLQQEKDLLNQNFLEKIGLFKSQEEATIQGILGQQAYADQQISQIPLLEQRLRLLETTKQENPLATAVADEQGLSIFDKLKAPLLIAGAVLLFFGLRKK